MGCHGPSGNATEETRWSPWIRFWSGKPDQNWQQIIINGQVALDEVFQFEALR